MSERDLRSGGELAVGIIIGFASGLLLLLGLGIFDVIPFKDTAFTGAILGALLAGAIGVVGQLLVLRQSRLQLDSERSYAERVKLEVLLGRVVRLISTFAQVRAHMESVDPFDNIVFDELPPLMKPLKINDISSRFLPEDLTLPLSLSDRRFFNLLNILDSIIGNFNWTQIDYEERVDSFLSEIKAQDGMRFVDGKIEGSAPLDFVKYHILKDLQGHHIDSVYSGLVVAKSLSIIVVGYLKHRHNVDMSFSDSISDEDWKLLFECVDLGDFEGDIAIHTEAPNPKTKQA